MFEKENQEYKAPTIQELPLANLVKGLRGGGGDIPVDSKIPENPGQDIEI